MTEPIFDHEKLDVYRLSIEYAAASYGIAKVFTGANRHIRNQWLRAAQPIPLNIAEGNGKQNLKDKNRYFLEDQLWNARRFTISWQPLRYSMRKRTAKANHKLSKLCQC